MTQKMKFYSLWLILVCIIVFILQNLPGIPGFTGTFVLNELALDGQVWRFFTSIFLHGSISHLLYNLLALFFFGIAVEKLIGSKRFLLVYFGSGIIANIISINFYPSSLGASGAIMGIIGVLTIIKPMMIVWAFGLILPMFIAAILWIIGDVFGVFFPSGVGNIAHLSGIGVGVIVGLFLRRSIGKMTNSLSKFKDNKKLKMVISPHYLENWENKYMK